MGRKLGIANNKGSIKNQLIKIRLNEELYNKILEIKPGYETMSAFIRRAIVNEVKNSWQYDYKDTSINKHLL